MNFNKIIEHFIKNPKVEAVNAFISLGVIVAAAIFAEKSYYAEQFVHWVHGFLGVLFLYAAFIRYKKYRLLKLEQEKDKTNNSFRKMAQWYKNAVSMIGSPLVGPDGIIYKYEITKEADLPQVIFLAHKAWDIENGVEFRSYAWRDKYMRHIYSLNNEVFSLIKKGDECIGYVSVLPQLNGNHFAGLLDQYNFQAEDIVPFGKSDLVYLQAIYIADDYQDDQKNNYLPTVTAHLAILSSVAKKVSEKKNAVLYAEKFTPSGEKVLLKWGFHRLSRRSGSEKPKEFWELSMNKDDQSEEFTRQENAMLTINTINRLKNSEQ